MSRVTTPYQPATEGAVRACHMLPAEGRKENCVGDSSRVEPAGAMQAVAIVEHTFNILIRKLIVVSVIGLS